jgi:hypothetical protein
MLAQRRTHKIACTRIGVRNLKSIKSILAIAAAGLFLCSAARGAMLLNDTWADADRTNTNLPTDSPTWIGQSSGNGSNSVSAGSLDFVLPTNSLKVWEYFTSDHSAPDANQPHNSVTQLSVGKSLVASASFTLPQGATAANTSKNFRIGLFFDPTDARVESDTNSDGGGSGSPWTDALGYSVQFPINSSSSGNNPLLIGKRTASNSSLLGSSGAYTFASTGGTSFALSANTVYTAQLQLDVVSASQLDVTASILQGNTTLTTHTVIDTGTAFDGNSIVGSLPGNSGIYTNFDQLFFRNSDNSQATELSFTNFRIETIPEPSCLLLLSVGGALLAIIRRRTR